MKLIAKTKIYFVNLILFCESFISEVEDPLKFKIQPFLCQESAEGVAFGREEAKWSFLYSFAFLSCQTHWLPNNTRYWSWISTIVSTFDAGKLKLFTVYCITFKSRREDYILKPYKKVILIILSILLNKINSLNLFNKSSKQNKIYFS